MARPVTALFLLLLPASAAGQSGTDIYLVNVERFAGGLRLGRPVNVTQRPGYDNQPAFLPDGSGFLYTAIGEDGQADTWRYQLRTRTRVRVTATPESEYSPVVTPDGTGFTAVRVERDSTQRLWRFALDGSGARVVFPDAAPVGYYAWLSDSTAALFVLGSPATLQLATLGAGPPTIAARDIGRTVTRVPGTRDVGFVQRGPDTLWIAIRPTDRDTVLRLIPVPAHEFYAWTADGALLAAAGSRLLLHRPGTPGWMEIADFAPHGITGITRVAVSPAGDWIAFVAPDP